MILANDHFNDTQVAGLSMAGVKWRNIVKVQIRWFLSGKQKRMLV